MSNIQQLLTEHIAIWTAADTAKRSGRGRSSNNAGSVYGVKKLRELILELAVRGKLVPQDPNDEPASELLKRIQAEKTKLIAVGKIKRDKSQLPITKAQKLFDLPVGWEWVKLGVITQKLTDGSHNPPQDVGYGIPMLSSQNINFGKIDFNSPSRFVSIKDFEIENSRTKIEAGDVLLTIVGSLGRSAVVPKNAPKFVLQRSVAVIRTQLFAKFLCLQLGSPSCFSYYELHGKGTAQKGIYLSKLSEMPIAIPSISEQYRIVAKVDELMALCDQLETQHNNAAKAHEKLVSHLLSTLTQSQNAEEFSENWQRIAAHFDILFTTEESIDTLKQTLLQLAVMGKLVPQNPNDEPASELLKRIQAEKAKLIAAGKIKKHKPALSISDAEKPFELPQSWAWVKPEEFSIKITDGEHFRPPTESKGVYFLSAKDVREEGVSLDDPLFISEQTAEKALQRCNPEFGDLLIVSRGATVGRICKVNIYEKFCLLGSVILIKPTTLVLSDYLSISLKSPSSFSLLINASGSTAQPAIYLKDLKEIMLPLPPIEEQHRIVAKVNELMSLCNQLKYRITEANQLQQKLADTMIEQAMM